MLSVLPPEGFHLFSRGAFSLDKDQLWETTLDPERRNLKQVQIEDASMASKLTEHLMCNDVGIRRDYIYEHANEAELDL